MRAKPCYIPVTLGKYVLSGSVSILNLEPEPPAEYRTEFTNITVEATLNLGSKEPESSLHFSDLY